MTIQVTRDRSGKMRHTVQVRQHHFAVDEPESNGGEDAGITPHEVYDSALGACKAMTVLWYANRKQIPVEDIEATVERDDSEERRGIYRLSVTLRITGVSPGACGNSDRSSLLFGARFTRRVSTSVEPAGATSFR